MEDLLIGEFMSEEVSKNDEELEVVCSSRVDQMRCQNWVCKSWV